MTTWPHYYFEEASTDQSEASTEKLSETLTLLLKCLPSLRPIFKYMCCVYESFKFNGHLFCGLFLPGSGCEFQRDFPHTVNLMAEDLREASAAPGCRFSCCAHHLGSFEGLRRVRHAET